MFALIHKVLEVHHLVGSKFHCFPHLLLRIPNLAPCPGLQPVRRGHGGPGRIPVTATPRRSLGCRSRSWFFIFDAPFLNARFSGQRAHPNRNHCSRLWCLLFFQLRGRNGTREPGSVPGVLTMRPTERYKARPLRRLSLGLVANTSYGKVFLVVSF